MEGSTEPELKAMNDIYFTLKDLDDVVKQRVLQWVIGKFSLDVKSKKIAGVGQENGEIIQKGNKDFSSINSVADIFANANVRSEAEKVLLVASYLQQKKDRSELTGREINKELNHLGHGVLNITNTISSLIKRKPQLMIQTRKEGKTKQAQKKYKVTEEGLVAAKKLINLPIIEAE